MEPAADILLPPPPPWWALHGPWLLAAAAIPAAILAGLLALRRRRRRTAPPGPPPPLAPPWADPLPEAAHDPREQAYRLAHLLRQGLGLRRLHPARPPPGIPPAAWARLVRDLDAARYRPEARPLDRGLLREARRWVEARSRGGGSGR